MPPSVDDIARLCDLVTAHRLDRLDALGVSIVKSLHAPLVAPAPARRPADDDDDELLFASADG